MRIGVFDSGVGGLTVLTQLLKNFPWVHYTYLGDNAHVPYGSKSPEQVRSLVRDAADFFLKRHKKKALDAVVIACNTASSIALDVFTEHLYPIPVVNVVDAGVDMVETLLKKHHKKKKHKPVIVFGTRATIQSGIYPRKIMRRLKLYIDPLEIQCVACPALVPLIEEGWQNKKMFHLALEEYLSTLSPKTWDLPGIAVLGCTHYPWARKAFERALPKWEIVDSGPAIVKELQALLPELKIAKSKPKKKPTIDWNFTDPHSSFPKFLKDFMS